MILWCLISHYQSLFGCSFSLNGTESRSTTFFVVISDLCIQLRCSLFMVLQEKGMSSGVTFLNLFSVKTI